MGFLSGCAAVSAGGASGSAEKGDYALGRQLLDQVFNIYRNYTRESFDRIVSRDFTPIRSEFLNGAERGFYAARIVELYYYVDTATVRDGLASVSFHWQKKLSSYAGGAIHQPAGQAEFDFRNEEDGWHLYQVRGDDPLARS